GDILYATAVIYLLYRLIRGGRRVVRGEAGKGWMVRGIRQLLFAVLWLYVLFNLLWGLNYDRLGIADQLGLHTLPYHTEDIDRLTGLIVDRLNVLDSIARPGREDFERTAALRDRAVAAYDSLEVGAPEFDYRGVSVKASLYSFPGLYIGFAGYYNPFTGEAQINVGDPPFTLPYTTCHEMGHQLGYAKESEANFVGFLAAKTSSDPAVRYSAYLELYQYCFRELYYRDSALAVAYRGKIAPGVRQDLKDLQRFNRKYSNSMALMVWSGYSGYLRANRQPHGLRSYSDVTAWLLAYMNKFGPPAL